MKKNWLAILLVLVLLVTAGALAVQADNQAPATCPHCDRAMDSITWTSWSFTADEITGGHYYLAREYYGQTGQINIQEGVDVCLDLRGKMYYVADIHPFDIYGTLTVMDSDENGQFITTGKNGYSGGFAKVKSTGTLNILGGTIRRLEKDGVLVYTGGLVYVDGGRMNVSGGALVGGVARANSSYNAQGGNIYMKGGVLTVSGGTITGGMAIGNASKTAQGGNIYAGAKDGVDAVINHTGGVISDGYSDQNGGNIYLYSADLNSGALIRGGHAVQHGGNIALMHGNTTVTLDGATVTGGVAGGKLNDAGQGTGGGGNIFGYEGVVNITDSTVDGDIRLEATMTSATLAGTVKIGLGKSNGYYLTKGVMLDVGGLKEGSEIFVCAFGTFTQAVPEADAQKIADCFKGAVRTAVSLESDFTLKATQGTTGYCPHCYDPANPQKVTWTAGLTTGSDVHCYMTQSVVGEANSTITANVVLDLNGYTLGRTNRRLMMYTANKSLTVMDSVGGGKIEGTGTHASYNTYGGLVDFVAKGTFTLYSGTLRMNPGDGTSTVPAGGVIFSRASGSKVVINGGVITGGALKAEGATGGGNIYLLSGDTLTVNAGIIRNGDAGVAKGGNIYNAGTTEIKGGFIVSGTAADGGNLYTSGRTTVSGGVVYGGTATDNAATTDTSEGRGGNFNTTAAVEFSGGMVTGGKARIGGNILVSGSLTVSGNGLLSCGVASGSGGNAYVTGTVSITGGMVTAGRATAGGNIYVYAADRTQSVSGGIITAGIASDNPDTSDEEGKGGNIYLSNGSILNVSGTAVISRGIANYGGGNVWVNGGSSSKGLLSISAGSVLGGRATGSLKDGGSVFLNGGKLNMSGGELVNGYASQRGGNIHMSNVYAEVTISGGTVTGGYAYKFGGNLNQNAGTVIISGGTVSNGSAARGGNLYLGFAATSTMIIDGDACPQIIGGKAKSEGGNIYHEDMAHQPGAEYTNSSATPWLAIGNCVIADGYAPGLGQNIFMSCNARMRVLESFKSTTSVYYFGRSFENNMLDAICDTAAGDFTGKLILENWESKPFILNNGGVLKIAEAAYVKNGTYTWFVDNAALMAGYDPDADYIKADGGDLTLQGGNYTIDLAGNGVNLLGTGTVRLIDSANDTYETYGHAALNGGVTLENTATVIGGKTYFTLRDGNTYTAHRMGMDITGVSLRPSEAGLYYTAAWQCDQLLAEKVDAFGVAVSLAGVPGNDFREEGTSLYTCLTEFSGNTTGNGVLVKEILKTLRPDKNSAYAQMPIYAVAYVTVDGQDYTGSAETHSLHSLLTLLSDEIYEYYTHAQTLQNFMDAWDDYGLTGSQWQLDYQVPEAIVQLKELYTGTTAYQGELHDHADTGGTSDGHHTLSIWLDGMKQLNMDFATIVDHKQYLHMELPEWDNKYFIGGTEMMAMPKDLSEATQTKMHYNMIFYNPMDLKAAAEEFDAIAPGGGFRHYIDAETGEWHLNNLQYFSASASGTGVAVDCRPTKEAMAQLVEIVRKHNGLFVHVHPKSSSYIKSDDPLDYWFADYTGLEVFYTIWSDRNGTSVKKNYKLWTDLLSLGKKVWATSGNDEHTLPSNKALSTIYSTQQDAKEFVEHLAVGNFTAGPVGVQMVVGDQVMGYETDFTGKQLAFRVSDFHSTVYKPSHTYEAVLIADEEVLDRWQISCEEPFYHTREADSSVGYYRVEIYDVTAGEMLALGNPIWNTAAQ